MNFIEKRMREIVESGATSLDSLYQWQRMSGLSESTFYSIVKGRRVPGLRTAFLFVKPADITVDDLFGPDYKPK